MQTRLADWIRDTPQGREAEDILRACVHCGFCNATCPTYRLLGDELDGPRGRIYQMKQMFEGGAVSTRTLTHLDRCLTCRNCETTCPSGVRYGRLLDIGREAIAGRVDRSLPSRWLRTSLRWFLKSSLFGASLDVARLLRPALRERLRRRIPAARPAGARPQERHARRMLVLEGCVQPELSPDINAAAARVLDRLGIELVGIRGCCGALDQHLGATEAAREQMRRNIDAWWPEIENGAEAIVMTASGCGVLVKDYGHLLADDAQYAHKAARIAALTRDLSEVLANVDLSPLAVTPRRIAFHPPCTLQHGQKLRGVVEGILGRLGFELLPFADSHLCCGSAGTYSILQPSIAGKLRDDKLAALHAAAPELIATANIGCQTHLATASRVPVVHWITLLDPSPPNA